LDNDADNLLKNIISNFVADYVELNVDSSNMQNIKFTELNSSIKSDFLLDINFEEFIKDNIMDSDELKKILVSMLFDKIKLNTSNITNDENNTLIKNICLAVIDEEYRNHLSSMDYLRQSIGLRGYAQKNPKNEYKRESFEMFNIMLMEISKEILKICCRIKIDNYNAESIKDEPKRESNKSVDDPRCLLNSNESDIPRNKRCPVTNMKYKQCCGKLL
jgi:preprotein translocase subunit SecA